MGRSHPYLSRILIIENESHHHTSLSTSGMYEGQENSLGILNRLPIKCSVSRRGSPIVGRVGDRVFVALDVTSLGDDSDTCLLPTIGVRECFSYLRTLIFRRLQFSGGK